MKNQFSFHENRHSIANAVGIVFIIGALYFKRDMLYQTEKITFQQASTPAEKIDKRPSMPDIENKERIRNLVHNWYVSNKEPLSLFTTNQFTKDVLYPIICKTNFVVEISETFTLSDIAAPHQKKQHLISLHSQKILNKHQSNAVARSYLGDTIYNCQINKNKFYQKKPEDINCQTIKIVQVVNEIDAIKHFSIEYILDGQGPVINCGSEVVLEYEIYHNEKLIIKKDKKAVIGSDHLPLQIEKGVINSRKNAYFFVKAKIDELDERKMLNMGIKIKNLDKKTGEYLTFKVRL